ncbi:MAG: penicillin-binding protein 2 [Pseudomonadota bacterium]
MTPEPPRVAIRPLARIIRARDTGEDPDVIERANLIRRHDAMRDGLRKRAQGRLFILGLFFVVLYGAVAAKMAQLAMSEPAEPRMAMFESSITSARANIVDRNGRILATNIETQALYAHPHEMVDIPGSAAALAAIFPDLDEDRLRARLSKPGRKFVWLRQTMTPEQVQQVHNIGEPGFLFATRDKRLYPNGREAAHVLGGAQYGDEGVHAAEVIGVAGVEKALNDQLNDPGQVAEPVQLSLDLPIQVASRVVLQRGIDLFNAKGGSAVVMDVDSGEIISLVSLPDFDPNWRPRPLTEGDQADSPLFNRAVLGVYELGSVFKIFTTAQAIDLGLVNASTMIDTRGPLRQGRHRINDFRNYGPELSTHDIIVKSSNIGTARIAQMIGRDRQREFLGELGFLDPTPLEVIEAPTGRPLIPRNWGEIEMMTISFGHGLSTSPVHLSAAYATVLNGGYKVTPTILKQEGTKLGPRVISEQASRVSRDMLRAVVTEGTASMGDVPGYHVGGKTGTADKPKPGGGYHEDKVLGTFAAVFPAHDPQYVVIVTLDEAEMRHGSEPRRTAGWTAVPVTSEMIRRIAPLMGMRPEIAAPTQPAIREARSGQ